MRAILIGLICFAVFYLIADEYTRENYMDTLWTQYGEMIEGDYTEYGKSLTSIDINGDGIDDLVVEAGNNYFTKFYFYLGNYNFDNIAEYTIYQEINDTTSYKQRDIVNIGDFNGDGHDDLMSLYVYNLTWPLPPYSFGVNVFFCGPDFDLEPDYTHLIPCFCTVTGYVKGIGDVNGDGFADIGYIIAVPGEAIEYNRNQMYIIYGDSNQPTVEYFAAMGTYHDSSGNYEYGMFPIFDINNDIYDDFLVKYFNPEIGHTRNYLYNGGNPPDTLADFSLEVTGGSGFGCGDYNSDGFNDFIGTNWDDRKLWYGTDQPLNDEPDLLLSDSGPDGHGFGDLNNDGYSDIVMANSSYSLWDGKVYIFMGGNINSSSYDYALYTHNQELDWAYGQLGYSIAVGDYNNDGFDDIAVGAPDENGRRNFANPSYTGYGRVFVFAGNGDLAENDSVDVDENDLPSYEEIELNIFPNPFNPSTKIEFSIGNDSNVDITIFNIEGQKVKTIFNSDLTQGDHSIIWNGDDENKKPVTSGIYYVVIMINNEIESTKKCVLLK